MANTFALPPLSPCSELPLASDSALILAAGFEDRTLASSHLISLAGLSQAIVLEYRPQDDRNQLALLRRALDEAGLAVLDGSVIIYDRYEPDNFPDRLRQQILDLGVRSVVLDVSSMSKLAIMLCLDVCNELDLATTLFYAEAAEYGPSLSTYMQAKGKEVRQPSIQVYTGVGGVVRCRRLTSVAMQGQPTAAIAFMSFNDLLTQAIVNNLFPSRLFLINGRPPDLSWREEATAWIHERLREEWPSEDNPLAWSEVFGKQMPERVVSTLDYRQTVEILLELYWQLSGTHRILLAPTGSKMQTVACFMAKAVHIDLHIEYPNPKSFLDLYSTGIGRTWAVNFGPLGSMVTELRESQYTGHLDIPVSP